MCKRNYAVINFTKKMIIIGGTGNNYGKQDEYILKHAVLEYRRTMNVVNTKAGKFFEFSEETDINGKKVYFSCRGRCCYRNDYARCK